MPSKEPEPRHLVPQPETEPLPGYTAFGTVLSRTGAVWQFTGRDLLERGLTENDLQRVSRMSHDSGITLGMRDNTRIDFTAKVISAITEHVVTTRGLDEERAGTFKKRLGDKVNSAIERDKKEASEFPIAVRVAKRLSELTGQNFFRLQFALEDASNIEEFLEILRTMPSSSPPQ